MAPKKDVKSSESGGRVVARWDDCKTEIFLKICVEEIDASNRPTSHFSKKEWKNITEKFDERVDYAYDRTQLKNRWDALRREFSSFSSEYIRDDHRYWPYFKDCLGEIYGTHIELHVPADKKTPFINRKGQTSTNVMDVCDFNMCFTFAMCGMEGSVHNAKILMDTLRNPSLQFPYPPEGYPSLKSFSGPYKNTRWRILQEMTNFKLQAQVHIIWACFAIHNFLRRMNSDDMDILESLENIGGLQDNEQNFNDEDEDDNGVPNNDEW